MQTDNLLAATSAQLEKKAWANACLHSCQHVTRTDAAKQWQKSLLDAADAIAAVDAVNADALSHITTSPHLLLSIYQYNTLGNHFFLRNYNFPELLT